MQTSIIFIISRSLFIIMRNFSDESCRENHNIFFVQKHIFEDRVVYKKSGRVLQRQAGHRWPYGACTLHAGYLRLQTHTQNMQYLLVSTLTMVVRMRPSVTLYVKLQWHNTISLMMDLWEKYDKKLSVNNWSIHVDLTHYNGLFLLLLRNYYVVNTKYIRNNKLINESELTI